MSELDKDFTIQSYLEFLQSKKLMGSKCKNCGIILSSLLVPEGCVNCGSKDLATEV